MDVYGTLNQLNFITSEVPISKALVKSTQTDQLGVLYPFPAALSL